MHLSTASLDVSPSQEPTNICTLPVFATLLPAPDLRKSYLDQTGKFPVQSSRGYNYVMILYNYDSNAILSKPLKTRQASEITAAWTHQHTHLPSNGYAPVLHLLDNKCSEEQKRLSRRTTSTSNASHHIATAATPQKEPSKPGKTISVRV
jgi:hypothetical protein